MRNGQGRTGLVAVAIDTILDNSTTDFDLFLHIHDHTILYGAGGYRWVRDELQYLLDGGHTHFYVRIEDSPKVSMYRQLASLPKLEYEKRPQERILDIENTGALFLRCLHEGELTPACVHQASSISRSLVDCLSEAPGAVKALSGLQDHDFYTFYHSVRVAAYAVAMCIKMGLTRRSELERVALGCLFHDIGKKSVPTGIIHKPGALTEKEWLSMQAHPQFGFSMLADSSLDHISLDIVLHHHEKLDGSGYPDGLDRNSLLPEVQIATVADVFDALTSSRSYQRHRSRFDALYLMKTHFLGAKITPESFSALVACLAS